MKSFLEQRAKCVKIGNEVSEHIIVNHRVPQGTVLKTLIFLLYVIDFSEKIKIDFENVQFADDTSILCRYEPGETNATKNESFFEDGQLFEGKSTHFEMLIKQNYFIFLPETN